MAYCRLESLVTIDDRGQMVIPKEVREKAKIRPGDKLAVMTWEINGEVCCIFLIKAENLAESAIELIGPIFSERKIK
ncbi:MAG: HgcAB-associated protein [Deltaproteobacteria bacterium]|nr:HgcAB-associated protein [Deltaproteobacteria bacterium]